MVWVESGGGQAVSAGADGRPQERAGDQSVASLSAVARVSLVAERGGFQSLRPVAATVTPRPIIASPPTPPTVESR